MQNPSTKPSTTSPSKLEGVRGACADNKKPSTTSPSKLEVALPRQTGELGGGVRGVCAEERVKNSKDLKELRRQLRSNSTPTESVLWGLLKGKKINGLQFRRQFSVEHFILDFYCPSLKLAIELDGDYHFHGDKSVSDMERDQYFFEKYQIYTLRFENKIVIEQPQAIINSILSYQKMFLTRHTPPSPL